LAKAELAAKIIAEIQRRRLTQTQAAQDGGAGSEVIGRIGGDDGVRTRDLRRDRPAF
jgi:hypothetical protein